MMLGKIWQAIDGNKTKIGMAIYMLGKALDNPVIEKIGEILVLIGGGHAAIKTVKKNENA